MKVLAVIPARYQSSRLPGKPIIDIWGKPMIWWVYQVVKKCIHITDVVVATDDERIIDVCKKYNLHSIMTSKTHDTPTSRLYEVSTKIDSDLYLLIMGDEPLVNEKSFDLIIPKKLESKYYVAALSNKLEDPTEVIDFSNQKVVTNQWDEVLLISRSPIPYPKGLLGFSYYKVTGVQLFSKEALSFFNNTPKSTLEKAEENDLMRFVENRIPVIMKYSPYKTVSVDTPKDLEIVINEIEKKNGKNKLA